MKTYRVMGIWLHASLTSRVGANGQLHAQGALPLGKELPEPIGYEAR